MDERIPQGSVLMDPDDSTFLKSALSQKILHGNVAFMRIHSKRCMLVIDPFKTVFRHPVGTPFRRDAMHHRVRAIIRPGPFQHLPIIRLLSHEINKAGRDLTVIQIPDSISFRINSSGGQWSPH